MSILNFFKRGLEKTKTSLLRNIKSLFGGAVDWDDATYDKLEAALVATDIGITISREIVAEIKDQYKRGLIATEEDILAVARTYILETLTKVPMPPLNLNANGPTVIAMVGVNGSGKTTSAAKIANYFLSQKHSVLLAAADTFRAAGIEQLKIWAAKLNCPVVAGKHGADAAAVVFDAIRSAQQKHIEFVIIDTAGRQHTRKDLMDELAKIKRTADKAMHGAPHETWLTVDASTGTNALVQAREFGKIFPVTGLVLTKLDGTGKGGIVVAIKRELGYAVRFVGLGEQVDDFQPFDPDNYVNALFS